MARLIFQRFAVQRFNKWLDETASMQLADALDAYYKLPTPFAGVLPRDVAEDVTWEMDEAQRRG